MEKQNIIINGDNKTKARAEVKLLFKNIETQKTLHQQEFDNAVKLYEEHIKSCQETGSEPEMPEPKFSALEIPEHILTYQLNCQHCGHKVGELTYPYTKDIEEVIAQGDLHTSTCDECINS